MMPLTITLFPVERYAIYAVPVFVTEGKGGQAVFLEGG